MLKDQEQLNPDTIRFGKYKNELRNCTLDICTEELHLRHVVIVDV